MYLFITFEPFQFGYYVIKGVYLPQSLYWYKSTQIIFQIEHVEAQSLKNRNVLTVQIHEQLMAWTVAISVMSEMALTQ